MSTRIMHPSRPHPFPLPPRLCLNVEVVLVVYRPKEESPSVHFFTLPRRTIFLRGHFTLVS